LLQQWSYAYPILTRAAASPKLQKVDQQEHQERNHQHGQRNGSRPRVVELLQLGDDQQGHDLRDHGHIAGDKDNRAVLANPPRSEERRVGKKRRNWGTDVSSIGSTSILYCSC